MYYIIYNIGTLPNYIIVYNRHFFSVLLLSTLSDSRYTCIILVIDYNIMYANYFIVIVDIMMNVMFYYHIQMHLLKIYLIFENLYFQVELDTNSRRL